MLISAMIKSSWTHFQAGTLYKTWAKANPGEDTKLRFYWNHRGTVPTLATETGQGFVWEAEAYWQAIDWESTLLVSPLTGDLSSRILVPPYKHPASHNGWASADFRVTKGEQVFAIEAGSVKHVYPDATQENAQTLTSQEFTMDGASGSRWFFAHVFRSDTLPHRPGQGDLIAVTSSTILHLSCSDANELNRLIYST